MFQEHNVSFSPCGAASKRAFFDRFPGASEATIFIVLGGDPFYDQVWGIMTILFNGMGCDL